MKTTNNSLIIIHLQKVLLKVVMEPEPILGTLGVRKVYLEIVLQLRCSLWYMLQVSWCSDDSSMQTMLVQAMLWSRMVYCLSCQSLVSCWNFALLCGQYTGRSFLCLPDLAFHFPGRLYIYISGCETHPKCDAKPTQGTMHTHPHPRIILTNRYNYEKILKLWGTNASCCSTMLL